MLAQQIKPDGVQRGLVGQVIARFESKARIFAAFPPYPIASRVWGGVGGGSPAERRLALLPPQGFVLKNLKLFQTPKSLAEEHYKAPAA